MVEKNLLVKELFEQQWALNYICIRNPSNTQQSGNPITVREREYIVRTSAIETFSSHRVYMGKNHIDVCLSQIVKTGPFGTYITK